MTAVRIAGADMAMEYIATELCGTAPHMIGELAVHAGGTVAGPI